MKYFIILLLISVPFAIGKQVWSQSNQVQKVESSRRLIPSNTDKVQTRNNTSLPSRKYGLQIEKVAKSVKMLPITILRKDIRGPNQIGVERKINVNFRNSAKVTSNPDGSTINLLIIRSPNAAGIRVNFDDFNLPSGDEVWIYGASETSQVFGPYTGNGPWPNSDFWSGIIEGDTAIVEYYSKSGRGNFKISKISHIFESTDENIKRFLAPPVSCQVDATCSSEPEKDSVGRIVYQKGGTFVCSSTLMNDSDSTTWIPYLLTANHCISTQAVAQTVTTYWFYQTSACNSGTLGSRWVQTASGANLLETAIDSDSTLLRLIDPAPAGAVFSGWITNIVNRGLPVFGLHHPGGASPPSVNSFLRRSAGKTDVSATCSATGLMQGVEVDWTSGTTEPGSSGSGLWQKDAFGTYLVGTLSCGSTTPCSNPYSTYGRFSSFYPKIQRYLGPATPSCGTGLLDSTFGVNGMVKTPIGTGDDGIASIAIQSDGRIVAAGYSGNDFALVRYKPDGSLDTSFGTGGKVITSITHDSDGASSVALQSDGKIVVAGRSQKAGTLLDFDFAVVRYNADGSLDNSFGTSGKVTTAVGISNDEASSVAIQSDGRIVVAGQSHRTLTTDFSSFAIVRYRSNGLLDTSFGTGGKVITAIGDSSEANSVALQSDGKIVAAGTSGDASGTGFAVVRYKTNGTLDTSFSFDGKVQTSLSTNGGPDFGYSVAIQPSDGKIVVAGKVYPAHEEFGVVRYESNGSLDTSFGVGGKVITDVRGDYPEGARSVAIQSDGKIITAGHSFSLSSWYEFALVRYDQYGSLDQSFGNGGKLTLPIGTNGASTVAIQSNGQIVVGGDNSNGSNMDFALVRLHPSCL